MKRNNKHNHSHFIAARGSLFCTAIVVLFVLTAMLSACSTTSALPEGEQLYTGMTPTEYTNYTKNAHFNAVQEELDIVLATKPNASLFGSPSLKSPFPVGLWIWNAFSPDTTKFGRWITRVFGSRPITLSNVSPDLHATVGKNLLNKRGYFNNKITHELVPQSNKKKIKLKYTVNMGHLWTIDSLQYVDFPPDADSLIQASRPNAIIKNGDAFDVATLEQERQRLTSLFRNNGYYYYKNNDASYLADTTIVRGKVITRLQLADSINPIDLKQWRIGKITVNLQKNFMEELRQHRKKQGFDLNFNGRHSPLRSRVIANDLQFRPGDLYQQSKHTETMERLNATRLFTASNISFKPSNSTDTCSTLNVTLDFMFDRPYDFYVEAYGRGKTTGKYGPELVVGVTKRNAFRGAELLNVRLHGAYEWTTKRSNDAGTTGRINDYQYGAEVSLQFPRFLNPFKTPPRILRERLRKREAAAIAAGKPLTLKPQRTYFESPMTTLSASTNVIKRALYFKRQIGRAHV